MKTVIAAVALCLMAATASAQDSVISRARALPRPEGIQLLATHLAASPGDVDARLVYGLLLSWERRYDEARDALQRVLATAPDYLDAQIALMNVEWWSGRRVEAHRLVNLILSARPGQRDARRVQQRLDVKDRPFTAGVGYTRDTFDDHRQAWQETAVTVGAETPAGTLLLRGSAAERFGLDDHLYEVEFYPTFRPGTTGYIEFGRGDERTLYPKTRVAADLYQDLGHGVEGSIGYRRLNFDTATDIYVATLSKYAGPWLLTGRVFVSPSDTFGTSQTYHAQVRRYFGTAATSHATLSYSRGFSRDEPRSSGDLNRQRADTVRASLQLDLTTALRLTAAGSIGRQQRATLGPFTQRTASAGLSVRF